MPSNADLAHFIKAACVQVEMTKMAQAQAAASVGKQLLKEVIVMKNLLIREYLNKLGVQSLSNLPKSVAKVIMDQAKNEAAHYVSAGRALQAKNALSVMSEYLKNMWSIRPSNVINPVMQYGALGATAGAGLNVASEAYSNKDQKDYLGALLSGGLKGLAIGAPYGLGSVALRPFAAPLFLFPSRGSSHKSFKFII